MGITRQAFIALADQVVVSASNFGTLVLLANWCGLSQAEVGIYALALSLLGFLRTAQERLISNPFLVFLHQPDQDAKAYFGSSLTFQVIFGLSCSALVFVVAAFVVMLPRPAGLAPALFALAIALPLLLLRDHMRAVSAAHGRFELALFIDICIAVLQITLLLVISALGQLSVPWVILILALACLFPLAAFWRQPIELNENRLRSDWSQSWIYARWLVVARTIGIGGYYAIPWLVAYLLDEQQTGIFATCSALVGLSLMFISGTNNYFQPRTVKAYHQEGRIALRQTIGTTIVILASGLSCVSLFLYVAGDWLMRMFGPEYVGYGRVVFLLSLSMLAVSGSIVFGNGFSAMAKPKGYLWGELAYASTAIVLAVILIPRFGLPGAAISLICAAIATTLVTGVTFFRLSTGGKR